MSTILHGMLMVLMGYSVRDARWQPDAEAAKPRFDQGDADKDGFLSQHEYINMGGEAEVRQSKTTMFPDADRIAVITARYKGMGDMLATVPKRVLPVFTEKSVNRPMTPFLKANPLT